ncbi:hypothetical protein GALMADRAFT_1182434 [Galerina marginata CBS 339.88]|uniref:CENP-V/GFA domain-containing protein n=1 Tax=Galerina marginata (strain CBS 339.88) TaxID=685588 RepID=A0A067TJQ9_GALM3|nr:hypothetical protein GALMADRAFT_1182434 [Galerina marginata CBS 339.88]
MSLTFVKASCHCGVNTFQIPFTTSKLPLASDLCHCNSCRHITGELAVHTATMEGAPLTADSGAESQKPADLSKLQAYSVSKELTRYFCSTCCAYILYETKGANPHWSVSTGALERTEGVVKVGYHAFLADTLDGGIADHYRVLEGVELARYSLDEGSATLPHAWKAVSIVKPAAEGVQERLAAYCHCKMISLYLTRIDEEETKDPKKWWAVAKKADDPTSRQKFMCGHCMCNSCRRANGSLINSWIIIPKVNVLDARTSLPVTFANGSSARVPGLKQYESSPGNYRESCGTCGATVFLWTTDATKTHLPPAIDGEPPVIDLSAGLVDQEDSGARAERWCHWYEDIIHPEDAIDKIGLEALKAGVKPAAAPAKSS